MLISCFAMSSAFDSWDYDDDDATAAEFGHDDPATLQQSKHSHSLASNSLSALEKIDSISTATSRENFWTKARTKQYTTWRTDLLEMKEKVLAARKSWKEAKQQCVKVDTPRCARKQRQMCRKYGHYVAEAKYLLKQLTNMQARKETAIPKSFTKEFEKKFTRSLCVQDKAGRKLSIPEPDIEAELDEMKKRMSAVQHREEIGAKSGELGKTKKGMSGVEIGVKSDDLNEMKKRLSAVQHREEIGAKEASRTERKFEKKDKVSAEKAENELKENGLKEATQSSRTIMELKALAADKKKSREQLTEELAEDRKKYWHAQEKVQTALEKQEKELDRQSKVNGELQQKVEEVLRNANKEKSQSNNWRDTYEARMKELVQQMEKMKSEMGQSNRVQVSEIKQLEGRVEKQSHDREESLEKTLASLQTKIATASHKEIVDLQKKTAQELQQTAGELSGKMKQLEERSSSTTAEVKQLVEEKLEVMAQAEAQAELKLTTGINKLASEEKQSLKKLHEEIDEITKSEGSFSIFVVLSSFRFRSFVVSIEREVRQD